MLEKVYLGILILMSIAVFINLVLQGLLKFQELKNPDLRGKVHWAEEPRRGEAARVFVEMLLVMMVVGQLLPHSVFGELTADLLSSPLLLLLVLLSLVTEIV